MNNIIIGTDLQNFLEEKGLKTKVLKLIFDSRIDNPNLWDTNKALNNLSEAFDWEINNENFENWFNKQLEYEKYCKSLRFKKITKQDFIEYAKLIPEPLISKLIEFNLVNQYIQNCLTHLEKYSEDYPSTYTIQNHLSSIKNVLVAFRFSDTEEKQEWLKLCKF